MESGYYERYMLSKSKLLPEPHHSRQNPFLDSYVVEFLDLPDTFHEDDFRKALIKGMRDFILELGKDFIFVGEEYPIQVEARIIVLIWCFSTAICAALLQWN